MSFLAQHFVLCGENSLNGAHEGAAFTGQIAIYFFSKVGLKKISAANSDPEGDDAVLCLPGGVLEDGIATIETTALEEHPSERSTGPFGRDKKNVDVFRRDDAGLFVEGDAESMGEVKGFAGSKV